MKLKSLDWILEFVAAALCIVLIVIPFIYQDDITGKVPTHFDLYGRPDAFDNGSIWTLPIIGSGLYLLLFFINNFIEIHLFSFPVKVTPENKNKLFQITLRMLRFMKISVVFLFLHLTYHTIAIAMGKTIKLEMYSFFIILLLIILPIIVMFVMMKKKC